MPIATMLSGVMLSDAMLSAALFFVMPTTVYVGPRGLFSKYFQYWLFLTFMIGKFESSKFYNCLVKPKFCSHILKSLKAKAKVNRVHHKWVKMSESEWFYQENYVSFMEYQ
jgi:hypothetical protein